MLNFMHNSTKILIFVILFGLVACQPSEPPADETTTQQSTIPSGQLPADVVPLAYDIDLTVDPEAGSFAGVVSIDVMLAEPKTEIYLHTEFSRIEKADATMPDGVTHSAIFEGDLAAGGVARLSFQEALPQGKITLTLTYTAPYNFGLAGLYKVTQANRGYLATQMEPIDARKMFPSFDDPQFKTPFTMHITAPDGLTVLTNGPVDRTQPAAIEGFTTHHFKPTRVIPTYLVAVAVGPYEAYTQAQALPANDVRPTAIPFRAFAPLGKSAKLKDSVDVTEAMLTWQESYFDTPYPYQKLDILAAPDFAFGAMENAGLIIYREQALLIDERTTLSRRYGIFTVHAHELAHQWFGNLVTPKWWDDIWLNEAFATWMAYKTMHGVFPDLGYDRNAVRSALGAMRVDQLASTRQIRNPINSNADIEDAFDAITYRKGGGVLNMFETYLGEDAFRAGVRTHMTRFADGVADVDDFMESLSQGSGNSDVAQSFRSFIFQPGIPYVTLDIACDADDQNWTMTVNQSRYAPPGSAIDATAQSWTIPFSARWANRTTASETEQILLSESLGTKTISSTCPLWVMPNAQGTGYWRFDLPQAWWDKLITAYPQLTDTEKLMMSDSLDAAFLRGTISAEMWQKGMALSAREGSWDARRQPLAGVLDKLRYLDDDTSVAYRKWATGVWQPLYDDLISQGDAISVGDALLRDRLGQFLADLNGAAEASDNLQALAAEFVGLTAEPNPNALTPALLGSGIAAGYAAEGRPFLDAALDITLATQNQGEQATILSALTEAADAADLQYLTSVVLGDDKPFKGREVYVFARAMMNNPDKDIAWTLLTSNFDQIAASVPKIRRPALALLTGTFCDAEKANTAKAFFESKADMLPGVARRLAQGYETATLCAAAKSTTASKLEGLFKN